MTALAEWVGAQAQVSARFLGRAISRTDLVHRRPAFGQAVRVARGAVLASPVGAHWDPEPDYFYNWVRDSAIAMECVVHLARQAGGEERRAWIGHFEDFVAFSLGTAGLNGRDYCPNPLRATTQADYQQYVRPDDELAGLRGDRALMEPRFNPDGTPDLQRWARPQHDGPALRALACLEFWQVRVERGEPPSEPLARLIEIDLDFTAGYADRPCIGPWEEDGELDQHYFTAVCQLGALTHGAAWAAARGDAARTERCADAAARLRGGLEAHWSEALGVYRALRSRPADTPEAAVDAAIFMAVLHARLDEGRHSLSDDRVHATVHRLAAWSAEAYPINRQPGSGPVIGRNAADCYFGGNPWFPTTFALAELCYALAARVAAGRPLVETAVNREFRRWVFGASLPGTGGGRVGEARALFDAGDRILAAARQHVPPDRALSEQFDKANGRPVSARHLTWSYAAFLNAARARGGAMALQPPRADSAQDGPPPERRERPGM